MKGQPRIDGPQGASRRLEPALLLAVVAGLGAWSLRPLEPVSSRLDSRDPAPPTSSSGTPVASARVDPPPTPELDRGAFQLPIWVVARPPVAQQPDTAPSPAPTVPLRLQLLAVITDSTAQPPIYKAMVYDPDSDRVLVVGAGERLGARTVDSVDRLTLSLRDDQGVRVLSLRASDAPAGDRP